MGSLMPVWTPYLFKGLSIFITFFLLFVGVDLMMGSKLIKRLSVNLNKTVEVDHAVLNTSIRIFVGALSLITAGMIFFMIVMKI